MIDMTKVNLFLVTKDKPSLGVDVVCMHQLVWFAQEHSVANRFWFSKSFNDTVINNTGICEVLQQSIKSKWKIVLSQTSTAHSRIFHLTSKNPLKVHVSSLFGLKEKCFVEKSHKKLCCKEQHSLVPLSWCQECYRCGRLHSIITWHSLNYFLCLRSVI